MAVTPKSGRGKPRVQSGSTTLSASEVLKAAEAAIAPPVKSAPPARKPAVAKAAVAGAKAPAAAPVAAAITVDAPKAKPVVTETPAPTVKAAPPKAAAQKTIMPPPAIEGTKTMTDFIETGKKFAEDAKAKFETAYADFNSKAKVGVEKSTKAIEELSDLTKGNVEALVESGKIAAKGMETMGQDAVEYGRKSFEKATASIKSFSTVKTPTEFFQLHSQLLSSSFDEFTKEAAKSSEALIKLASEVAQPLTARVTVVTDKVKTLAA